MKDKEMGGKEKQSETKNSGQKTSTDQDTKDTRKSENDCKKEKGSESKKTKEKGDGDKAKFKKVRAVEVNADRTAESNNGQYKLNMKDQGSLLNQAVEWILTLCKQNKVWLQILLPSRIYIIISVQINIMRI